MKCQKVILKEVHDALLIAESLGPELREALFKKLVKEYIKAELPNLYELRNAS